MCLLSLSVKTPQMYSCGDDTVIACDDEPMSLLRPLSLSLSLVLYIYIISKLFVINYGVFCIITNYAHII